MNTVYKNEKVIILRLSFLVSILLECHCYRHIFQKKSQFKLSETAQFKMHMATVPMFLIL
jgi:hypothetical protein